MPLPPTRPADAPNQQQVAKQRLKELKRELARRPECDRAQIEKRLNGVPQTLRIGYLKASLGQASPRQAIRAYCAECVGWDRREVAQCTAPACPLYQYRPWKEEHANSSP